MHRKLTRHCLHQLLMLFIVTSAATVQLVCGYVAGQHGVHVKAFSSGAVECPRDVVAGGFSVATASQLQQISPEELQRTCRHLRLVLTRRFNKASSTRHKITDGRILAVDF